LTFPAYIENLFLGLASPGSASRESTPLLDPPPAVTQWRRSVVKCGVRVNQVKPSNCYCSLEKLFFSFRFWHKSFILDDVKRAELSNNSFEWKNVTFWGSEPHPPPPPVSYNMTSFFVYFWQQTKVIANGQRAV